jgi:sulfite reductase (ferredoxin)
VAKESVETIKANSEGLRGSIAQELGNGESYFSEAAKHLIKFHGMYQQQDRDARRVRGEEKPYSFMIRTKLPGGQLTAEQYLTHDWIATEYANDTLRITTRQCFQFHGVIKSDLQGTLRKLNDALVTTYGACGDIARNVMVCPAPTSDPQRLAVQEFAHHLSRALFAHSNAYHQIWLDGEAMVEEKIVEEPLYGATYLPRKFKLGIALPGDNCVDVYTHDVGLVALFDEDGILDGFNVLAGGGMGMTHNNNETFARLADVVAFVKPDEVVETVKAIIAVYRDYGDRTNRKHARLKYVLHDWGVEKFRDELQQLLPFALHDPRPMPEFQIHDHMGWHEEGDNGKWYLGVPVENGRVDDWGDYRLRSGLREIISRYNLSVRLTPQQSIILTGIDTADRPAIEALIKEYGIHGVETLSRVRRYGLACVALPTCGLAITEAERVMPDVLTQLETTLAELGLSDEPISVRMTGCPNGCARPYVAEIAFVGRSLDKYTILLGGSATGTRLAQPYADLVHLNNLVSTLRPVLVRYRDGRHPAESFGDFVARVGVEHLRPLLVSQEPAAD